MALGIYDNIQKIMKRTSFNLIGFKKQFQVKIHKILKTFQISNLHHYTTMFSP